MGPQHIAAENATPPPERPVPGRRFNGAAAHRCGKPRRCARARQSPPALQWGRSTSLRKTRQHGHGHRVACGLQWGRSTSLRKTSCKQRNRFTRSSLLQWGRSTSLRKTSSPSLSQWVCSGLQWGRSTSLRKTARAASVPADVLASMGPQHIAAENATSVSPSVGVSKLQWGRSTSLRKTVSVPLRFRQHRGFNGAAAHRCGKH